MLNLGLRYEYQQLPQPGEIPTEGVTFNGNPRFPQTMSFHQDKNNWAPRIGLTYDFGGDHLTVLRAAYGLFYGLTSNSAVANAITEQRHQPGVVLLHADHSRARRSIRTC